MSDAPLVSLNMPSEQYDHQKALKEERARDMKSFLDKQARENPRLRRLRAFDAPIQTSITHPNQAKTNNIFPGNTDNTSEHFTSRTEGRGDSRFVESERKPDSIHPKPNRSRVEPSEQYYDYGGPSIPPDDGYRYNGGSWPRYNPPPPMWYPPPMPQNNYYPDFNAYSGYPDRNYQRDNYGRTFEPMPPNAFRDPEPPRNSQYQSNPSTLNRPERKENYNREFAESEPMPPSAAKSKAQGYAAELRKLI